MTRVPAFVLTLALAGCAATQGTSPSQLDLAPGQRPSPGSDEAGLWMQVERAEEALHTSGRVVTDPALTSYVRDVVCRVAGPLCQDIRVYVLQSPGFNASMAPNGAMQVWTGLLLRAETRPSWRTSSRTSWATISGATRSSSGAPFGTLRP